MFMSVFNGVNKESVVEIRGCGACAVRRLGELLGPLPEMARVDGSSGGEAVESSA